METVLWLSHQDVLATGVCGIRTSARIVEQVFHLFDERQALIVPESALRLAGADVDRAFYCLPAQVGGAQPVCGIKWSAHTGPLAADSTQSRIHATVILSDPDTGAPVALLNGTEIGAARTGAVTAVALKNLAPLDTKKVALCGAGGQAEHQLQAALWALPQLEEVSIWSRGTRRAEALAARYQSMTSVRLTPTGNVDQAVAEAQVIIAATSAESPYMTSERLKDASLYCHIGFNEITAEAIGQFSHVVVDTWEEAKDVSGQSLFRCWRDGSFSTQHLDGTLGAVLTGRLTVPRGTPENKVMFDAFGLPIFDLGLALACYQKAKSLGLGTVLPW